MEKPLKKTVHYYPFGLKHKGYNNVISSNGNSVAQKFKYNSIEFEEALGLNLYEMEIRNYDPALARWISIDPVTHHTTSTYNAFDNNPIFWADPSGADSFSFIMDIFGRSSNGEKWTNNNDGTFSSNKNQKTKCKDCKYEIFNAFFIGDKLKITHPTKDNTANDIIGYGFDPKDQQELYFSELINAIKDLKSDDAKEKLLKKLGVGASKVKGLLNLLKKSGSISPLSFIIATAGATSENGSLANLPIFGFFIDMLDDPIEQTLRETDYIVTWDNARNSLDSLLGIEDFNNVVIVYSNELLTSTNSISESNTNVIDSPHATKKWKYANVATQLGNNIYILKTYEIKD
ncbi:RHS repeat domain-containing protein [Pseudotenacibaculum haliotis]|uniref:RHS repeat domain-containing protein n=1 Tax=Pseudotenacibaculum haliotis TaxID=1862138 RepID=A0ABW5LNW5_9FLAO